MSLVSLIPEKLKNKKKKKDERARDRTVNLLIRTVGFISSIHNFE